LGILLKNIYHNMYLSGRSKNSALEAKHMFYRSVNNMRKTIMHVLNTGTYSGAENVVMTIISALRLNNDYDFIYVSLDGSISEVCKNNNIRFVPIEKMSISEIRRVVKVYRPDIIHAHDFTASIICACSGIHLPVISHLHNNPPWLQKYCINSFAYLFSCLRYVRILAVSKSILDEYIFSNFIKKISIVVSNPVDISIVQEKAKLVSNKKEGYDIVFIGRLSIPKNPQRFIGIIDKVRKDFPTIKAAIIGAGILENECRIIIEQSNLNSNIELLGFIENPYGILSNSKMLCITSDWEGFGLVAVEALSLGKPVIATPVGGLPSIVNNDCGRLCETDDEFAVEIKQLLLDKTYWCKKSKMALNRAKYLNNIYAYIALITEIYNSEIAK